MESDLTNLTIFATIENNYHHCDKSPTQKDCTVEQSTWLVSAQVLKVRPVQTFYDTIAIVSRVLDLGVQNVKCSQRQEEAKNEGKNCRQTL